MLKHVVTICTRYAPPLTRAINCEAGRYETVLVEQRGKVALVTLNRPKALNSINPQCIADLTDILNDINEDDKIGAVVLTGSTNVFAAGGDITVMKPLSFTDTYMKELFIDHENVSSSKKPTIAAVNGFALGGGCQLAMMCDIIYAGDNAKFGQPGITLGTVPGAGGSQRLPRAVGKSKSMEMCLTGMFIDGREALRIGLVSQVYPVDEVVNEAVKIAEKIASFSKVAVRLNKDAVNAAFETTLQLGLEYEKQLAYSSFATNDQKEGMDAFEEKRTPEFTDR